MKKIKMFYARFFLPNTGIYLWSVLLLAVLTMYLDWRYSIPAYIFVAALLYLNHTDNRRRLRQLSKYLENLNLTNTAAAKGSLMSFPIPVSVQRIDGSVIWCNSLFRSIFDSEQELAYTVAGLTDSLKSDVSLNETMNISRLVSIGEKQFHVMGNFIRTDDSVNRDGYILILYYIDQTELTDLRARYFNEKVVTAIVIIDNYDDLMQSMEDAMRPQMLAEIDRRLVQWVSFTSGVLKKFERDKYILIFEYKYLRQMEDRKFDLLDQVKEINLGNRIPVTLSIGFGLNGKTYIDNFQFAHAAIDIALGRGGDQAVIKNGENFSFYGGKTRELEKRTKVKARVIAHALRDLIDGSSSVIIMGHDNCDVDCFGAALGVYRIVRNRDRQAFIVRSEGNPSISVFTEKVDSDPEYQGVYISGKDAVERLDVKTLLVVVDTYRAIFTEYPELVDKAPQVIVMDHHRKGTDYIQDAVLSYQETYASSTCELVTELLQYIDDKPHLKPIEVEALYAGILVDTRNFTLRTGVRTFEAASYLKRQGVDIASVRQMLQDDMQTYRHISDIVRSSEIIRNGIAISVCPTNTSDPFVISAKAADELLDLQGITASFVLCDVGNGVINISGRSMGDLNVQVILEKLGGGGHLTSAGAQITSVGTQDAKEMLKYAIIDYIDGNKRD